VIASPGGNGAHLDLKLKVGGVAMNPLVYYREQQATGSLAARPNYGPRADGTPKGNGFFGPIADTNGTVMTELGIGIEINGKETQIPSVVPTLTADELNYLREGNDPTPEIVKKAVAFARERKKEGKPFFATPGEEGKTKLPEGVPAGHPERDQTAQPAPMTREQMLTLPKDQRMSTLAAQYFANSAGRR
jgi:hypothetical protein